MNMGPGDHRRPSELRTLLRRYARGKHSGPMQRKSYVTFGITILCCSAMFLVLSGASSYLDAREPTLVYPVTVDPPPSPDVPTSSKSAKGGTSDRVVVKRTPSQRVTPASTPSNVRTKPAPKRKTTAGPTVVPEPSVSPTPTETDTPNDPPVVEQTKRWHCNWDAGSSD